MGTGGTLKGVGGAGVGVGAPRVVGIVVSALTAGGDEVTGVVLAPAYFRISPHGRFTGFTASAFNHVRGEQRGLSIGLFNFARESHGVQLGVLNYAKNNRKPWRLLPLLNVHAD